MHRVRPRGIVRRAAIPLFATTIAVLDVCPACGQPAAVPSHDDGFVAGGIAVSVSERALNDALQDHVLPALRDSLTAALDELPGKSVESLLRASGVQGTLPEMHGAAFEKVRWNPDSLRVRVDLVQPDTLRVGVRSGPIVFEMSAETCHGNCLIGCCLRSRAKFEVQMQDVQVGLQMTPQELLHGAGAAPGRFGRPTVDIRGLDVRFGTPHVGGVVGWLSGAAVLAEVFNLFGVPRALLGALAGDTIVSNIQEPLEDAFLEQFPAVDFAGLESLDLAPDLPPSAPVRLETRFTDVPEIHGGEAITLPVGTVFAPRVPGASIAASTVDATLTAAIDGATSPDAATLGGDVAIGTNEDALNQLLAALASAGSTRTRFDGLRFGDLVPGMSMPWIGVGVETPVSIAIDAARAEKGARLPPRIEFEDDPETADILEAKLRLRMTVRGILPRGVTVADTAALVPCSGAPSTVPCVLSEGDVDLDLLVGARLEQVSDSLALVRVQVNEVLELAVTDSIVASFNEAAPAGRDSSAAQDSLVARAEAELQAIGSSETSPMLALVRDRLNAFSVPIRVPLDLLTLGGWMEVTNLRWFTTASDSADADGYLGILADLDDGTPEPAPAIAAATSEPEPLAAAMAAPAAPALIVPAPPAVVPVPEIEPAAIPETSSAAAAVEAATEPVTVADSVAQASLAASASPSSPLAAAPSDSIVASTPPLDAPIASSTPPPDPPVAASAPEHSERPVRRYTRWQDPEPTSATIRAGMPSESTWILTIYDETGRAVRRLRGNGGPGWVEISWDGRAEDGRAVAGGDYVYHFETAGYEVSRRLQLGD